MKRFLLLLAITASYAFGASLFAVERPNVVILYADDLFSERYRSMLDLASRVQAVIFAYETGLVVPGTTNDAD